jgi:tetratricopeptide (TPR) repeat protein
MSTNYRPAAIGCLLLFSLLCSQGQAQDTAEDRERVRKINEWFAAERRIADIADPYRKADELRKAGRNEEALVAVNEALRANPNRGEAYGLRSGIEGNLQYYEDGVRDADIGLQLSKTPRDKAMAAYSKGFNLTSLDRKQEALEAYKLALQFDPTYSMAHFGKGKLFYLLGMWKEAKQELDRTVELSPSHGAAWAYRAEVQFRLGSVADGVASAEKAVLLAPKDSRSYRARAIGRQLNKRFDEMLSDATRALELDPSRPLAHLLRGKAFGLLGKLDEALAEYALEPDRKAVEPYLNGVHREMYGTRFYNCGNTFTEFEVPLGPRFDTFEDCKKRIFEALSEVSSPVAAPPTARKSIPNLPARRQGQK